MTRSDNPGSSAPEPPKELTAAMQDALGANPSPSADEMLDAADRLLTNVLASNCESRASALDLLTVDALVTSAMEVCANDGDELHRTAERALRAVAAHADPDSPAE